MAISTHKFNTARQYLIAAGSATANACHAKHGGDSWPNDHGVSLLCEARDEFDKITEPATRKQKRAVVIKAASEMNITAW
jgi:hypothetical protein